MKLKVFLTVFLMQLLLISVAFAEVSTGFRMGILTDVKTTGLVMKSSECTLSMGVDGEPLVSTITVPSGADGKRTEYTNTINPWKFTYRGPIPVGNLVGQYMVVSYKHNYLKSWVSETTDYVADTMKALDSTPMKKVGITSKQYDSSQDYKSLDGLIVQASYRGKKDKLYEATVQVGLGGNDYRFMSFIDEDTYNFGVETLKRGVRVRIIYGEVLTAITDLTANTPYRIVQLECIDNNGVIIPGER